jgi:hypothetical protein
MKRCALLVIAAIVVFGTAAFGESDLLFDEAPLPLYRSRIAMLDWNQSNIHTLRSLDKAAIVKFLEEWPGTDVSSWIGGVEEVGWFDLAGDGKYELALTESSGPCCVFINIYWQEAPGKFRYLSYRGGGGDLKDTIRDLNGDGKKELILNAYVDGANYEGITPEPVWPQVYRLENGKYVEASRDFPNFYDNEVLPDLDKEIIKEQGDGDQETAATRIMGKDKILRVLGRNPVAGVDHAREWMNSDNMHVVLDAVRTFRDIGGHEEDVHAAMALYHRMDCKQYPHWKACKNPESMPTSP